MLDLPIIKDFIPYIKSKKVVLKVLGSSYVALPIRIIVAMFTYRFIEPYYMGIWAALSVFETYANVLRLGVTNGMNREIPFARGAGDKDKETSYAQTTYAFNLFSLIILWILVPIIIKSIDFNSTYLICFGVYITRVSLSFYTVFLSGIYRTTDNFNKLTNIQFIISGLNLLMIPLIYYYKFNGYLAMQTILICAEAILLHIYRPLKIKPKFNLTDFKHLFKIGFPLFISSYIISFIDTIPKLFILKFSDETHLGIYSPVLMVFTIFSLLPTSLSTYFYPKLSFVYGKTNRSIDLWNYMKKIYLISFAGMIPLVVILYYLMDDVVALLPKYQESLPYMRIALLSAPFLLSKLGNLINVVLMNVKSMGYYIISYGILYISFVSIIYIFFTKDVLLTTSLAYVFTNVGLFTISLIFNYTLVKKHDMAAQ